MSTIICTKKPLNELAVDIWQQMDETERIRFLQVIYPATAMVVLMTGKAPDQVRIHVSPDTLIYGNVA